MSLQEQGSYVASEKRRMKTGYRNGIVPKTAIERLNLHLKRDLDTGCLMFTGAVGPSGYGAIRTGGKGTRSVGVHRVAYEAAKGPIPKGLHIDHLCRNPLCCNPDHLEAVSQRENTLRGVSAVAINARKTHCVRGHEYTAETTIRTSDGRRRCRTCNRQWKRDAYAKRSKGRALSAQKHARTPSDLDGSRCWRGTRRHVNAIAAWLVHSGRATVENAGQRAVEMIRAVEAEPR